MPVIVSGVPKDKYEKLGVSWPDVWDVCKETITKVTTQDRGHYLGTRVVTRQH